MFRITVDQIFNPRKIINETYQKFLKDEQIFDILNPNIEEYGVDGYNNLENLW